ncbi:hypothetical protein Pint_01110 [Pistacia integerrima]|uniref:Uncharacterized protein n=1 Tax=Pistacia integerrima TaxID=434235 RepID=A0ACC0ZK41_9ROSI|nr:hypothetical protein Pint_01110 [Pistacia integerrima]
MMTDGEILNKLEESTKNANHHQLETLHSILQHQSPVLYLQSHLSLSASNHTSIDAATFKRAVPLSSYDDYAYHINQLASGSLDHDHDHDNQPLLSVDPLVCFFYSSGTSSMKPKLIPYFDSALSKAASHLAHQGSAAVLRRLFPPKQDVNKILCFIYADNITTTKGGFKVMAASTFPLYRSRNESWSRFSYLSSPREVILGSNAEHQMYCHLLCGLRNSEIIDGIINPYAVGLIRAFSFLESKWEQLCDDLRKGYPYLDICDNSMRDSVTEVLGGPRPDLSERIRSICRESNWSGIVSKLWPNVRYIRCVTTGSMRQYCSKVKYYAGEVPVLGGDYFASECCVGINLDIVQPPETTRFVMLPTAAYFEFLPFDLEKSEIVSEETVDFSGVEVGKMYEVAVTTYRGFYRYRLGDIVKVVGFYNSSPEVEFVMRAPKSSFDIITERDLMSAMESFQKVLRNVMAAEIVEFASFINLELSPKKLIIFLEIGEGCIFLQEEKLPEAVVLLRRCCSSLEDELGSIYKVQRDKGAVSPLSISILKPSSFERLFQVAIEHGAPASQYKPPKIIRNREIVQFLEGCSLVTLCLDDLDC